MLQIDNERLLILRNTLEVKDIREGKTERLKAPSGLEQGTAEGCTYQHRHHDYQCPPLPTMEKDIVDPSPLRL